MVRVCPSIFNSHVGFTWVLCLCVYEVFHIYYHNYGMILHEAHCPLAKQVESAPLMRWMVATYSDSLKCLASMTKSLVAFRCSKSYLLHLFAYVCNVLWISMIIYLYIELVFLPALAYTKRFFNKWFEANSDDRPDRGRDRALKQKATKKTSSLSLTPLGLHFFSSVSLSKNRNAQFI